MARFDLKKAIIKIKDGDGNEIQVKIGDGNLSWSEKRQIEYLLDRGEIDDVREGDQEPVEVSLDLAWEFIKSSTGQAPSIYEVLKQSGAASTWVSSDLTNPCAPYAVNIEVIYTPQCAGVETETFLLKDYRYESLDFDADAATIATSGMCNVRSITSVRS